MAFHIGSIIPLKYVQNRKAGIIIYLGKAIMNNKIKEIIENHLIVSKHIYSLLDNFIPAEDGRLESLLEV
jgi:hypothetical protein